MSVYLINEYIYIYMYEDDSKLDKLKETVYIYIFKKIARCHITPHNAVCHITVSNNTHTHVYILY